MPRSTAVAPCCRAKSTIIPSKVATETFANALVDFPQHLHALVDGKQRIFDRIDENGDGEMLKEPRPALNQVDVTVGRRVEGAGIEGFYAHCAGSVGFYGIGSMQRPGAYHFKGEKAQPEWTTSSLVRCAAREAT